MPFSLHGVDAALFPRFLPYFFRETRLLCLVGPQVGAELQAAHQHLSLHLACVLGVLGSGCEVWYFYWPLLEAMPFLKAVA